MQTRSDMAFTIAKLSQFLQPNQRPFVSHWSPCLPRSQNNAHWPFQPMGLPQLWDFLKSSRLETQPDLSCCMKIADQLLISPRSQLEVSEGRSTWNWGGTWTVLHCVMDIVRSNGYQPNNRSLTVLQFVGLYQVRPIALHFWSLKCKEVVKNGK